jgi:hypothetical protein
MSDKGQISYIAREGREKATISVRNTAKHA